MSAMREGLRLDEARERLAVPLPEFLTVREVAGLVRLSETAVRRAVRDGELEAVKLRGQIRISEGAVRAWVAKSTVASPSPVPEDGPRRAAPRADLRRRPGSAPTTFREMLRRDA
jgi:excisionase family DNA binding protein